MLIFHDYPVQGAIFDMDGTMFDSSLLDNIVGTAWTYVAPTVLKKSRTTLKLGGVLKSMLTLNEAIIDVKKG